MNKLLDRFFHYMTFDTQSKANVKKLPSSEGQKRLVEVLEQELKELGLTQIVINEQGDLFATLPSNVDRHLPVIAFIAHLDTSPSLSSRNITPQLIDHYRGGEVALGNGDEVLSPIMFPILRELIGHSLVTTNGKTLLGSESKAAIAEIMVAIEQLQKSGDPHGEIKLAFLSDIKVQKSTRLLHMESFSADWAYSLDCSGIGNIANETFNAASAYIKIVGNDIHCGLAKDVMVNALTLANRFQNTLPSNESPENVSAHEGFYHLHALKGGVELAEMHYLIRDFSKEGIKRRKQQMLTAAETVGKGLHHDCYIEITITDEYYNVKEQLAKVPESLFFAEQAVKASGLTPNFVSVRGGGMASRLTSSGLPCVSLSNGGFNFHSKHEFVSLQGMEHSVEVIKAIAKAVAA